MIQRRRPNRGRKSLPRQQKSSRPAQCTAPSSHRTQDSKQGSTYIHAIDVLSRGWARPERPPHWFLGVRSGDRERGAEGGDGDPDGRGTVRRPDGPGPISPPAGPRRQPSPRDDRHCGRAGNHPRDRRSAIRIDRTGPSGGFPLGRAWPDAAPHTSNFPSRRPAVKPSKPGRRYRSNI